MHPALSPTSAWKPALACSPVVPSSSRRVAVGFFGLSRNLRSTLPTIERNVIAPLREASGGLLDTFVHAMLLTSITNARSSEFAEPIDRPKDKKETPKRASGEPKHPWEVGRTEFKERETEIKNEQKPPRYDSKGRSLKAKPCGNFVSVAFKEPRAENKGDVRIHGQIPRSSSQKQPSMNYASGNPI